MQTNSQIKKRLQPAILYSEDQDNNNQQSQLSFQNETVKEDLTYKFQKSKSKKLRVFSDGVYDCMHYGHFNQLKQIKDMFPDCHLIVGVSDQKAVEKHKGPTVMTAEERVAGVENCRWADEVYYPCPWVLTKEFLEELDIDVVCHDSAPYKIPGADDMYATAKELGKFQATQRTEGVSTSDIIMNVLVNREYYILQLIKEGYSRKDLNVSLMYYLKLKAKFLAKSIICPRRPQFDRKVGTH